MYDRSEQQCTKAAASSVQNVDDITVGQKRERREAQGGVICRGRSAATVVVLSWIAFELFRQG